LSIAGTHMHRCQWHREGSAAHVGPEVLPALATVDEMALSHRWRSVPDSNQQAAPIARRSRIVASQLQLARRGVSRAAAIAVDLCEPSFFATCGFRLCTTQKGQARQEQRSQSNPRDAEQSDLVWLQPSVSFVHVGSMYGSSMDVPQRCWLTACDFAAVARRSASVLSGCGDGAAAGGGGGDATHMLHAWHLHDLQCPCFSHQSSQPIFVTLARISDGKNDVQFSPSRVHTRRGSQKGHAEHVHNAQ
jgi:hypothetical protein